MTTIVANQAVDEAHWKDQRRRLVTGTDVVKAKTSASQVKLAREKQAGSAYDLANIPAVRHGKMREVILAAWAQRRLGLQPCWALIESTERPGFACSPDLLDAATANLPNGEVIGRVLSVGEIKTGKYEDIDSIPKSKLEEYEDQLFWEMDVNEADEGRLIYEAHEDFVPRNMEPEVRVYTRDAKFERRIKILRKRAEALLALLSSDLPPADDVLADDFVKLGLQVIEGRALESQGKAIKAPAWEKLLAAVEDGSLDSGESELVKVTVSRSEEVVPRSVVDEEKAREQSPEIFEAVEKAQAALAVAKRNRDDFLAMFTTTTTETVTSSRLTVTAAGEARA